jgi:hypothetical protein
MMVMTKTANSIERVDFELDSSARRSMVRFPTQCGVSATLIRISTSQFGAHHPPAARRIEEGANRYRIWPLQIDEPDVKHDMLREETVVALPIGPFTQ